MKKLIVFILLGTAALTALIEGTIAMLTCGRVCTHIGLRIGKFAERFY